ncbi:MAG TPA: apolipoprotein N-acyltransferase [Draconibacterium sp.]|nr:apolipoprotein N-acyltransferase [Draconibacterium sp.]
MKRSHRLLLSVVSGVLLSLAWLGFHGWILFVAFLPLLTVEKYFTDNAEEFRGVSFWGHALLTVFIWNLLTTWWIMHATIMGAVLAIVANSFLMSLTWWLAHAARRKYKSYLGYIALIVFWISFEYFHFHWDIEWPWLQLGNGFANNVKLIQWYEFTGAFGGTLWVLTINVLIFKIIEQIRNSEKRASMLTSFVFTCVLIIPIVVSLIMYSSYKEKEAPKVVTIIQPNIDPYSEKYDMAAETAKKNTFLRLAQSVTTDETDYIVGPETVYENPSYWDEAKLNSNLFLADMERFLRNYAKAQMVFGVSSFKIYNDKNEVTSTARTSDGVSYDRFNTALFLDRNGKVQIYHKSKLVVGVEKMPFMKYLGFINDIVINIGGTTGSLGRQTEASVFTAQDGTKIAPVICYESVFGEYVTDYVKKGAGLIFIITNDGWWKNTPGYKQHMSFARLRAIENRRSIARSANTGISCFINQCGDVSQVTGWWVEAAISGKINTNDELTFYTKNGDYIARISLFVSVLLILLMVVKRFR